MLKVKIEGKDVLVKKSFSSVYCEVVDKKDFDIVKKWFDENYEFLLIGNGNYCYKKKGYNIFLS